MNMINRFSDWGKVVWNQTTGGAKIGLIAAAIVSIALVIGVGYWSAQPYYVPLTEKIGALKAAEVKEALDAVNISNKLSYAGNSVLVDQSYFSEAKIAISGILDETDIPFSSSFGGMFGDQADPGQLVRQREESLASKLENMKPITKATVSLAIPKSSPFVRDRKEPTASVTVALVEQSFLTRKLASAIAMMVSSSVEGMRTENVKVFDVYGNYQAVNAEDSMFMYGDQNEVRMAYENLQAEKALVQLEAILGIGMAEVSVTAEIDFNSSDKTATIYDPDKKVKKTETLTTEESTSAFRGGPAGTSSNIGTLAGNDNSSNEPLHKREDIMTEYEITNEILTERKSAGTIKHISISVVAEIPEPVETTVEGERAETTPLDPVAMQNQLEDLVKAAVGFDESRGDQFELMITKLAGREDLGNLLEEEAAMLSPMVQDIIRNASLGVASLVALLIGVLLIKRIQPFTVQQSNNNSWSPERTRQISDMSTMIRENPELLSRIVAAWSGGADELSGNPATDSVSQKAA